MTDLQAQWDEFTSEQYREIASVAVPQRAEQLATLLSLIPFAQNAPFHAVEVGSGEGLLSAALLACFPRATLVALDGSASMRTQSQKQLSPFGNRGRVEPFELESTGWHQLLNKADVVLSSLCLHHLPGDAKRRLFATIGRRLTSEGALLIADLVEPQRPEARLLFAATWDRQTEAQSLAQTNSPRLFDTFCRAKWNYYRYDDPADRPSPLFEQLLWLKEAGFAVVDCFWMQAGHAIYGGYKNRSSQTGYSVPFEKTLSIVQELLDEVAKN